MENLAYEVALHARDYDFVRVDQTIRVKPSITGGLTDRLWSIDDLVALTPEGDRAPWGAGQLKLFHYPVLATNQCVASAENAPNSRGGCSWTR